MKIKIQRQIHKIDAQGKILGRLSTEIAQLLQGKGKPEYQPNIDIGDFVHVLNADKIKITGNKLEQKQYYRHSRYAGGLKKIAISKYKEENPAFILKHAVNRMLPKNKLRSARIKRLVFVNK